MTTKSASKGMLAWTAIMLNLSACNGQPTTDGTTASIDTLAQRQDTPQVEVRVNKEYDEHGNLIAFDSSYSSVYHGRSGDAAFMDSMFKDFMPGFGMRYPFLNDPGFNNLFFPDSSFHQDFFHDDFFQKRMETNQRYMQRMMEQMDSLKNQYFLRPAPPSEHRSNGGLPGGNAPGSAITTPPPSPRGSGNDQRGRHESVEL
ncbi:MAG: hypothetical protein KA175_05830 [Flavobacteriales bacterium]|nr:hypothetical protein [Flavobacteriales bacterium]MBP6697117.1 hypothetical protein [Flavobacteriales bacterium]